MDECDLDSPTLCVDESSEDEESESFDSSADDGTESEDEASEDESSDESNDITDHADDSESNSYTGSTSGGTAPIEESGSELEEEEGSCVGACCHGGTFVEECVGQPCDVPIDYDYESKAAPVDPKSPYYSEIQK